MNRHEALRGIGQLAGRRAALLKITGENTSVSCDVIERLVYCL